MQFKSNPLLPRRTVLRGLGCALSLPLLDAMLPSAMSAPSTYKPLEKSLTAQPRLICCYIPNGVNIKEWMPNHSGKDFELSATLKTLEKFRDQISVVTGLGHSQCTGGHSGADTWLTGADLKSVPGADYTNEISLDQVIAEQTGKFTRIPSLQLSDQSGTGSAGHSHTLSFDRSGTPLPAESSPRRLFDRLFVPDNPKDRRATLQRYAEQKSILDSVLNDAKSLQNRLGRQDRKKLDEYFSSVRETETRVTRAQEWIDVAKPSIDEKGLQLASLPSNSHDRPMWLDVMLELCYLSFVTDTTRVIAFEWSREAGGFGGGGENHHELSHHGGDAGMLEKLAQIDRFHLERLARFMEFLQATSENGGNMLDRTAIVFGSGMNSGETGDHSPKNLPLLIAGGGNTGLKHGQHLAHDAANPPPLANAWLSVAQAMGVQADSFQDSTSTLTGL